MGDNFLRDASFPVRSVRMICKFGRSLLHPVYRTYLSLPVRIPARGPILENRAYQGHVGKTFGITISLLSIRTVKCSAFQAFLTVYLTGA